jgi:type I restriction enzyme, S subunit
MDSIETFLDAPFDEAVDARRNQYHVSFIPTKLLGDRLNAQAYRPEVVAALTDLKKRHRCSPLSKLASRPIRQGSTPEYGADGPPCLKLKQVQHILVETNGAARVSASFAAANQISVINSESVFINRSGGFTIGRTGAYLGTANIFVSDDVFAFLPSESTDAGFIACFLNSWWGKRALEAGINGSTGQLKLPQGHVGKLLIPEVPREVQKRIGDKVRKAHRLREIATLALARLSRRISELFGAFEANPNGSFGWLNHDHISTTRLDSWFNQPRFVRFADQLDSHANLAKVRTFCRQSTEIVRWKQWSFKSFEYFEIGGIDSQPGQITSEIISVSAAPSRAKYVVRPWDVLVSTVRPNLKSIAFVPETTEAAVCSSGFSVLRASSPEVAGYVWACLVHEVATQQLMRWNTGATYPAIERSIPLDVSVPSPGNDEIVRLGSLVVDATRWNRESRNLVEQAKDDVESLIDGTLDERRLFDQGEAIAAWLAAHPLPESERNSA